MNYSDLLSAAENDITARKFCSLVDAADKLYEEEISNCHTEMKNGVTRSNPQRDHQNLDVASTSSSRNPSLLLDFNKIPPDDDSDMIDAQNPNSSSSSRNPSLRLDLNTIKPYRELRSVAENDISSRRFCALVDVAGMLHEEEEEEERYKRIFCLFPRKTRTSVGREIPESVVQLMNDVNENVSKWGERTDLRLIFQRRLFETDVNPRYGRLLMPFNQLIRNDFLKPVELRYLRSIEEDINNDKKTGIGAVLFDQRNVKWGVMLKRWEKEGTWNYYVLTCGWKDVVEANGLKQGDDISIWSFRWGGVLCFALVTPPPSMAQSSSSRALSI